MNAFLQRRDRIKCVCNSAKIWPSTDRNIYFIIKTYIYTNKWLTQTQTHTQNAAFQYLIIYVWNLMRNHPKTVRIRCYVSIYRIWQAKFGRYWNKKYIENIGREIQRDKETERKNENGFDLILIEDRGWSWWFMFVAYWHNYTQCSFAHLLTVFQMKCVCIECCPYFRQRCKQWIWIWC